MLSYRELRRTLYASNARTSLGCAHAPVAGIARPGGDHETTGRGDASTPHSPIHRRIIHGDGFRTPCSGQTCSRDINLLHEPWQITDGDPDARAAADNQRPIRFVV